MSDGDTNVAPAGEAEDDGAGSGAHSLAGYDYQVDVSVWLGLDLMLANKFAQTIELEPASEEDLEADLDDSEPGRLATNVAANGYKLVVQAKLRNGDAWTVAGINALLKHGSKDRLSAARRLAAPDVRYLLITSAALNGKTRGLRVGRPGNWPKPGEMPAMTVSALPASAAGRVGIIGNLDEDRLVGEIKRLLVERFGVPNSRWIACLRRLREEARMRMRRVAGGQWRRDEVAYLIREHDGYLAASPQLENYVFPTNWSSLHEAMNSPRYAALIIGQSGTGKTLATSKLYEVLRAENPGLTRVPIRHGPQQLRDDQTPPPVLYDIEDPWGRYDFDPASRPWTDQLAQFLAKATHDRRIVVTTRRDVGQASGVLKTVEPWLVSLEVEHYGPQERRKLYRTRIETLPRDVQLLATNAERQVLDRLGSPLEIEKYFDALRTSGRPDPKNPQAFVGSAIGRAHEESIELTVVQQIQQRGDIAAAAGVWGLLKASDRLSLGTLRSLELDLADRHPRFEAGIQPFVDFFAAARNLRIGEGDATYYHPRVEAGILAALKQAAVPASLALRDLVDALTDPDGPSPAWGAGVAARILKAVAGVPELSLSAKPAAQKAIDLWIDQQFSDPATRISEHLDVATAVGSDASVGAEFGRYIGHRRDGRFASMLHWSPPGHDQHWYDRMRDDPQMMMIATRFVREVLPEDRTHYGKAIVHDLDRMAPGLTPVFLEAAAGIVHRGFDPVVDTLAEGALRDLAGFETIVDAAVTELTPSDADIANTMKERLAFINGVYSDEYAEHVAGDDDGHSAQELLSAYVDKVRVVKGWQNLAQHRHAEKLLPDWMRSLRRSARDQGPPTAAELAGAFAAVQGGEYEDAVWYVLRLHWDEAYLDRLTDRVVHGANDRDVRVEALTCLIIHHPELLPEILDRLGSSGGQERAIELAIDLGYILPQRTADDNPVEALAAETARDLLPPDYAAIAHSARTLRNATNPAIPLPPSASSLLVASPAARPEIRRLRIRQYADLGSVVEADIETTLAEAEVYWEDNQRCSEAIAAAIALGSTRIVENALDHKFSDVVAPALSSIGEPLSAPLPQGVLELAKAEGSPVRKALVSLLISKPHADHISALMTLAHDEWSASYRMHDEDDYFPIARQAVAALGALTSLAGEDLERLDALGIATTDNGLREAIFALLATHGGPVSQERLLERACSPGRAAVRRAAARAMLLKNESLDSSVAAMIDPEIVATRIPSVAAALVLMAALRASDQLVTDLAQLLAGRSKRRVLVLLAIWAARDERPALAISLEAFLPSGHPAIAWLKSGPKAPADDDLVRDLGDSATCEEVLRWLNPREPADD